MQLTNVDRGWSMLRTGQNGGQQRGRLIVGGRSLPRGHSYRIAPPTLYCVRASSVGTEQLKVWIIIILLTMYYCIADLRQDREAVLFVSRALCECILYLALSLV